MNIKEQTKKESAAINKRIATDNKNYQLLNKSQKIELLENRKSGYLSDHPECIYIDLQIKRLNKTCKNNKQ